MGTERETNRKNSAGMKCADLLAHVSNANKYKFLLSSSVTVSVRFLKNRRVLGPSLKQIFMARHKC